MNESKSEFVQRPVHMIQQRHSFPGQSLTIANIMANVAVAADSLVIEPNLHMRTET